MVDIVTRLGKGSPLTNAEVDANFTNLAEVSGVTGEPMGHEDRTTSTISFNASTRTFTIAPVASSFTVWCKGKKVVVSTAQTVTIPNTTGMHSIYYDANGTLSSKLGYFTFSTEAPTAYVYWNATTGAAPYFGDERHGVVLDWQTHEYLHRTRGAAIANGFLASGYTLNNSATNAATQIAIESGTFFDEDMKIDIVSTATPTAGTYQQNLLFPAKIPALHLQGTSWVMDAPTDFPFKQGTSRPQYNSLSGGVWSTADVGNNQHATTWILATNNLTYPVIAIIGQSATDNLGEAEAFSFADLTLTGFPSVEFRPLYKLIYKASDGYANSVNAQLVSIVDLRSISAVGSAANPATDHGNLSGLSDDDHPQYIHVDTLRTVSDVVKASFLPSQTSNDGKFLQTNGTATSWAVLSSANVTTALGFTPYNATNPSGFISGITSGMVTTALGFTPYDATNPSGYVTAAGARGAISVTGAGSYDSATGVINIVGGLTSFNTRTGAITLSSTDVTTALGFTPYNNTNPSGYITGITSTMVTTALGFTPYNSSNPSGYITGITSGMVTTALGFTPYNNSNPSGYITSAALSPYLTTASAASTYAPLTGGGASGTWGINVTGSSGSSSSVNTSSSTGVQSNYIAAINTTTPGTGTYGVNFLGSSQSDYAQGITWTWSSAGTAQAGIYVQSSGAYGTKMYFGTTDSFAVGSKTSMSIDHVGTIQVPRSYLQSDYSLRAPIFYDSNNTGYYVDPASTSTAVNINGGISTPTMWVNYSTSNYNGYNENIRLYPAGNNVSVIAFGASGSSGTPWNSILGFSDRFEIRQGSQWQQRNYADYVEAYGSFRAPIFYDSNNTGYYVDPASTSYLNRVLTPSYSYGAITSLTDAPFYVQDGNAYGSNTWFPIAHKTAIHNGGYRTHLSTGLFKSPSGWGDNSTGWYAALGGNDAYPTMEWRLTYGTDIYNSNGYVSTSGSFRAPIFYDSNNTGYYVDPASTSNLNSTVSQSFRVGTDAAWKIRGNSGNAELAFEYSTNSTLSDANIKAYLTGGTFVANGDIRAPIFYDSNDTGYYLDPTSGTTSLKVGGALYQGTLLSRPYAVWGEGGTVTGAIVIKLPGTSPSNYGMIHAVIDIYEYNGNNVSTIVLGGHNWSTAWYNYGANVTGYTNKPIRLCVVGGQYAIVIGNDSSTWEYGQVVLRKIQNGAYYSGAMDLGGTYSIYRTTSVGASWDSGDINSFRSTTITGIGSVRAPIFYDYNDTNYYVDPTNTSVVNTLRATNYLYVGNGSQMTINYDQIWRPDGGQLHLQYSAGGNLNMCNGGGYAYVPSTSIRAPIFYDQNDTAYYVDPNGTTQLNYLYTSNNIRGGNGVTAANASISSGYGGFSGTPSNGYLITTNISYGVFNMPTVIVEGYAYGNGQTIHIEIVWYSYANGFVNYSYTNLGAWDPGTVRIGTNGSDKICIHFSNNIYYGRMNVRAVYDQGPDYLLGWSVQQDVSYSGLSRVTAVGTQPIRAGINTVADCYVPILYDVNNTAYYCDPHNRSNFNQATFGGGLQFSGKFCLNASGSTLDNSTGMFLTENYGAVWNGSNSATWHHQIINASSLVGFYANAGNFGSGNILASGNITAYYSDERLKTKVSVIENALDKVRSLEGFIYVENELAKSVGYTNSGEQAGVSAQRVKAVLPQAVSLAPFDMTGVPETGEIVSKSGENYLTVDYARLSPLLIEAIKEQDQEVVDLRARVAKLEALVSKLIEG